MDNNQNYELLGVSIESFMKQYQPKDWREKMRVTFNSFPPIYADKAKIFADSYAQGTLEKTLETDEDRHFKLFPVMRSAVLAFFNNGEHKKFVA
ncbi:MAG: hypothetical protein PHH54_00750 [Candidatus Nanoarchaeia archaeon]|nr:hypothetical protein [Candidatus Nanoarchaeia archaeon]MDD5740491.1 hypothetical protein [Candidatus Nanoarchaeia archaeon]